MIRINAFIRLKDAADAEQVKQIAQELVTQSRKDEGNIAYDLFHSATDPQNMIFCETWENIEALKAHEKQPHFTTIVPQISKYTDGQMKLEKFEF